MKKPAIAIWAWLLLLLPTQVPAMGMMEHLAREIVRRDDTHDVKMRKIERWVRKNVEYRSDELLYGRPHAHYHPSVTIRSRQADCEDGALLIHSLAGYAGIPLERLRTVMGIRVGEKHEEGHAWTLYRRDGDRTWVVVDWTRRGAVQPLKRRPVLWLTPGYREYRITAYLVVQRLRPFKVSYVQVQGDAPVARLGLPRQLDRLLGVPPAQ